MEIYSTAFTQAFSLILSGDAALAEIFWLSVKVSLTAVLIACAIGLPLGAVLAVQRFSRAGALVSVINTLMGMPPVVVGLIVYLHLSSSGASWLAGSAVYADRDDHCPGDFDHTDHCGAQLPDSGRSA